MEVISVANLPKGTRKRLEKKAVEAGYTKHNGSANLSAFLRSLFEANTAQNETK